MWLGYKPGLGFLIGAALFLLPGCQGALDGINQKANVPVPRALVFKMKAQGMRLSSPIMLRIYKQENVLEVWKQKSNGRYGLLTDFEICKWSGKFGPKYKEGDRQAPEGFYHVNKHQMNPNSQYHLSFNMGYPNAYDRAHGRTGAHLMVHGACSSAGCYSMTDERVEVIYSLARDAFKGGQRSFQIQAYPFRMTAENMVKNRNSKHFGFWKMIKKGNDLFEIIKLPPKVDVCARRYEFGTQSKLRYPSSASCPPRSMKYSLASAYLSYEHTYAQKYENLLAKAEGRTPKKVPKLTFAKAFPGVTVVTPKVVKPVESKPADTKAVQPVQAEGLMTKAEPAAPTAIKSPPVSDAIEASLKPAG